MDDLFKGLIFVVAMIGAGVGAYAGITAVSILKRRFEKVVGGPALPPEELDAIHARLAAAEALEGRVNELEERVDFAERLLAKHSEAERLPGGEPVDQQH